MSRIFKPGRLSILLGLAAGLFLSACNNQYGPPVPGQPLTWGQKHYLHNKEYQQINQDRMP